jgi:hypothetical protein
VARFLDPAETARPDLTVGLQAQCLVTIALLSTEMDRSQFVAALLRALERARPVVASTLGDPAYGGLAGVRILLERGYYRGPPAAAQDLLIRVLARMAHHGATADAGALRDLAAAECRSRAD